MTRLIRNSLCTSTYFVRMAIVVIAIVGYFAATPQSAAATTFTVNSTVDLPDLNPGDGICNAGVALCTLRAAVMESNYLGGANVINVPAGTYTLTIGPYDDEFNGAGATMESGDLDIMDLGAFLGSTLTSVTINGAGSGVTIIDGGAIDRVLDINNFAAGGKSVDVTINGVTIRNGNAPTSPDGYNTPAGGIQFDGFDNQTFVPAGTLTINNCIITNNSAAGQGGGVLAIFGSLIVSGTTLSGNTTVNAAGGGISYDGSSFSGLRTLQITTSKITSNHANNSTFGSGGGVSEGGNATKSINYTVVTNNTAGNQGGGVFNVGGDLTMNFNVIVDNTAAAIPTSSGFRNNTGLINAENNWWGCNQGPTVAPCDRASGPLGSGIAPWLTLSHTATPNTINTGQSTTLQADFFTNSANTGIAPSDLGALDGRAVVFNNPVLGTISGADPTIQSGKANATFTAGATPGNGSADATVDHQTVTAAILIVQAAMVATNPINQTACDGGSVTFTASATGSPTPTVQWQVSTGGPFTDIPGATSTTLTFTATLAQNGNQYRAVFTNAGGTATTTAATLTVNAITSTTDPADQTVCQGATANFSTTATGTGLSYAWTVDGSPFGGNTSSISVPTGSLSVGNHTVAVTVTGTCGTASQSATLTVQPPTSATTPANQAVCKGGTASFSTTASGTGPFTYQWKLDGSNIPGATGSSVSINTTSLSGGNHTVDVVVSGACSTVIRSAILTVNTAPVVTLNPVSQTATSGTVTFTAAASGIPAPTVQWQVSTNGGFSFNNIPGATSTSLTVAATPANNGNKYRAVFTNGCGTATTTAATLTTCQADLTKTVGLDSVTVSGSGRIDSYSSAGGYPATQGSAASVISNGTITMGNSGKIFGSARSTQVGINMSGATNITGNATAGTTVSLSGSATVGGIITNNSPASVIVLPSVTPCGSYSSGSGISGTYSYSSSTGNLTLSGVNVATLANGTYCFNNITLTNSAQLKVNGPVVIKLTGTLSASGASSVNNTTAVPANLRILSSYTGSNGVSLSNASNTYMVVYAPQTSVSISGSAPLFGAVVGKTLSVTNSGAVHFDIKVQNSWPEWCTLSNP
jgi:CSLREA domain-containing protein